MTEPAPIRTPHTGARIADAAGVFGAIVAALCCAGTPLIVSALAAAGLSSLRRDSILWPVMLASLGVALWGFSQGYRFHRNLGPLLTGALGSVALACGVIVVHGPPAMAMIYSGALLLIAATVWNIATRWRFARKINHGSSSGPAA